MCFLGCVKCPSTAEPCYTAAQYILSGQGLTHTYAVVLLLASRFNIIPHYVRHYNENIHDSKVQGSWGQHGARLGPRGPRWPHVGPMNFAIWDIALCYLTTNLPRLVLLNWTSGAASSLIEYYNMTVWIWVGNYISFTIAAGLIRLHMPGVKKSRV